MASRLELLPPAPPGHSVISVLHSGGDLRLTWNPEDPEDVARAREELENLKRAGYEFFLAEGPPADPVAAGRGTLVCRQAGVDDLLPPAEPAVRRPVSPISPLSPEPAGDAPTEAEREALAAARASAAEPAADPAADAEPAAAAEPPKPGGKGRRGPIRGVATPATRGG